MKAYNDIREKLHDYLFDNHILAGPTYDPQEKLKDFSDALSKYLGAGTVANPVTVQETSRRMISVSKKLSSWLKVINRESKKLPIMERVFTPPSIFLARHDKSP